MPTRRSTSSRAATTGQHKKKGLRHAATVLPLAISLACSQLPSAKPPSSDTETQGTVQKGHFTPVCTLPFAGAPNPPSDSHCGMQGGSSDPAKQAESMAKNNFCVAKNVPGVITYQELVDLQAKSSAAKLPKSIPDRSAVQSMGEGKYVSYVAFIKEAHYSDTAKGEAVNCNIPGSATNDIHIVLMPDEKDTDECHSTTAEMSPHYRPESWTPTNIEKASAGHPVRLQGHLFYDGSHSPCTATTKPNPKRASLWEIHPVYSFEVCNLSTIAECQGTAAEWTPLEKVFSTEE